jgi:hypothetical protein
MDHDPVAGLDGRRPPIDVWGISASSATAWDDARQRSPDVEARRATHFGVELQQRPGAGLIGRHRQRGQLGPHDCFGRRLMPSGRLAGDPARACSNSACTVAIDWSTTAEISAWVRLGEGSDTAVRAGRTSRAAVAGPLPA